LEHQIGLPLIVGNDKNPIINQPSSNLFMGQIDYFINKNVEYEFFRYISPHVLFQFSHSLLRRLEKIFNDLQVIASNNRDSFQKLRESVNGLLKTDIQSLEELTSF